MTRAVVVGWGWAPHPDLPGIAPTGWAAWAAHGTRTLGVLSAMAPSAELVLVPRGREEGGGMTDALRDVLEELRVGPGDVLLVEGQLDPVLEVHGVIDVWSGLPVEVDPRIFELLRAATDAGAIVIEPAGNGGWNLDPLPWPAGDSGALLVGACGANHVRFEGGLAKSCHGARVRIYGPGEGVATCCPVEGRTNHFRGTSAASAVVAGTALALLERGFPGRELRAHFLDDALTIPVHDASGRRVGGMPR